MTGRPFTPKDENGPLLPQHGTANAESGQRPDIHRSLTVAAPFQGIL